MLNQLNGSTCGDKYFWNLRPKLLLYILSEIKIDWWWWAVFSRIVECWNKVTLFGLYSCARSIRLWHHAYTSVLVHRESTRGIVLQSELICQSREQNMPGRPPRQWAFWFDLDDRVPGKSYASTAFSGNIELFHRNVSPLLAISGG